MTNTNAYETLYTNLKDRLTIEYGDKEYNLAEFMLMQAGKEKAEAETKAEAATTLPTVAKSYAQTGEKALSMVVSYVNEKLAIKEPPVKDKTIRAFPFRASASALISAVACCALVVSIGVVGLSSVKNNADGISMTDYYIEDAIEEHVEIA